MIAPTADTSALHRSQGDTTMAIDRKELAMPPPREVDRRQLLARAGGAGALAALAALWKAPLGVAAASEDSEVASVAFDVACLGDTFHPDAAGAPGAPKDLRGGSFFVEGWLYPAGTIPEGSKDFDPSKHKAFGNWLCRGWFLLNPNRALPHVITTQEYYTGGVISPTQPSPSDQLVSSGTEGGVTLVTRAVTGGTGRYRGARGEVRQLVIGSNTTVLNVFGEPGPNFRFTFHLL